MVERIGVVFVGAFEPIRRRKVETENTPIGFVTRKIEKQNEIITQNDLLGYGIVNELVGRLSVICNTNSLTEEQCLQIVKSENSRTGVITKVLSQYGISPWDDLTDSDIIELIKESNINQTGIRSVITKVENILLSSIHSRGIVKAHEEDIGNCLN